MQATLYLLRFPHGLHIGSHGVGTEDVRPTIPSDTLFAALLASWVRLGGDPEAWSQHFPCTVGGAVRPADPPFLLSSAFPFAGGVLFYPRPMGWEPPLRPEEIKTWNKVEYLSEAAFRQVTAQPEAKAPAGRFLQGGRLFCVESEWQALGPQLDRVWTEEEVPRVTLDRVTSASNLFSMGRVHFHRTCGLWLAVVWRDPERRCGEIPFRQAFQLALDELARQGLGGDRAVGYGTFEYELLDEGVPWLDPQPGKQAVLLSRYHPREEELPWVLREAVAYRLEPVAGWGASPQGQFRRRGLWMMAEGSVIRSLGSGTMGDVVDVSPRNFAHPGHPVWRYGLALAYPWEGQS